MLAGRYAGNMRLVFTTYFTYRDAMTPFSGGRQHGCYPGRAPDVLQCVLGANVLVVYIRGG